MHRNSPNGANWKLLGTTYIALGMGIAILILGYAIAPRDCFATYTIILFGAALGWVIAILTSPYDAADKKNLNSFSKLVGSFLSGYILSKFDKVLDAFVKEDLITNQIFGLRALLFLSTFFIVWIVVYVYRVYAD